MGKNIRENLFMNGIFCPKKKGDTVKVYYHLENPSDFRTCSSNKGAIAITIGIIILLRIILLLIN